MISVVLPTIAGREDTLARAIAAYEDTLRGEKYELIVVKDKPNWPTACNEGYLKAKYGIIHFSSDDLEAVPGWWQPAVEHLSEYDELPAAAVYNFNTDDLDNGEDGEDGAFVHFTRVPILRRDQYERIGTWPEIAYYADIWLSEKARTLGIRTRILYGYAFIHHWSGIGRLDNRVNLDESGFALNRLREQMV